MMTKIIRELKNFIIESFSDVRSSHRTRKMHSAILNQFLVSYPEYLEYDWQFEWRLTKDGFGGTFDIDIVGFQNGNAKIFLLCKSINSSYAKNSKNYANCTIGEMHRVMDSPIINPKLLLFINLYPRKLPIFNRVGNVVGIDDVKRSKEKIDLRPIMRKYKNKVLEVDITYDIENLDTMTKVVDFSKIEPKNIDEFVIR